MTGSVLFRLVKSTIGNLGYQNLTGSLPGVVHKEDRTFKSRVGGDDGDKERDLEKERETTCADIKRVFQCPSIFVVDSVIKCG